MGVIISILAMFVGFILLYLIGLVIEPLFALLSQSTQEIVFVIGFIALFIATIGQWYRSAYVTGKGKKWHFWLAFATIIMFVIVFFSMVTQ